MKQYKVLKEMINAPVGTILIEDKSGIFSNGKALFDIDDIDDGVLQGFIEPYTPEPKHWRAVNGNCFYFVDEFGDVYENIRLSSVYCSFLYNIGNYYRTRATAELVAKAQKLLFELLHDTEITYKKYIKLEKAIKEARKACEKDDSNE